MFRHLKYFCSYLFHTAIILSYTTFRCLVVLVIGNFFLLFCFVLFLFLFLFFCFFVLVVVVLFWGFFGGGVVRVVFFDVFVFVFVFVFCFFCFFFFFFLGGAYVFNLYFCSSQTFLVSSFEEN